MITREIIAKTIIESIKQETTTKLKDIKENKDKGKKK